MKRLPFTLMVAGTLVLAGCSKELTSNADNTRSVSSVQQLEQKTAAESIHFIEPNLFPEGVVYDQFNNRFYVSSVNLGDIGIVEDNGDYTSFITDPVLIGTTGLEIDNARKRLYVSNAPNGVGVYDINTGQRIFYADLASLIPGASIFINDIALDPQGNAYVTNSLHPVIYKITPDGQASIFYEDPALALPPGSFGFNGIEYSTSGFLLVAVTATNSVLKFPVNEPSAFSTVMLDASLNRPDGLLLSNDGKELTVVNNAGGGEGKVLSFTSKDKFETATLTGSFITGPVFPTTATTDGKNVYVLHAYLHLRGTGHNEFTIQPVP